MRAGPAGQAWENAQQGRSVPFGAVVRTGNGFAGALNYADGTALTLKPQTILQVLPDGLRLYRGQTWIKVIKRGKGFTCVTPSAIASVRGTSFSVEVPSMARVFGRRLKREFFDRRHLGSGVTGTIVCASIGLAVLGNLLEEAPGGRVPAAVKVYEGRVLVSYPAHSGSIKKTWTVDPGEQVVTDAGERSTKTTLAAADYAHWGLPQPSVHGPEQAPRPSTEEPLTAPASNGPSNPVHLLNEPYDVR